MPCGWEGNRRSGVALATCHRLQWFIRLNVNRLFAVPFSNTYDDSFLDLGIHSLFCVLKFPFVFLLL